MSERLPKHIAIIMDGNGRWAENRGLPRFEGHRAGVATIRTIVECCLISGISTLSLFAFSSENWLRPSNEVEFLMQLFLQSLEEEIASLHEQGIALRFTGSREELSLTLQEQMHKAEQITAVNNKLTLNIVINYGGRWDIVQASKILAQKVLSDELTIDDIDEAQFNKHLATKNLVEPDLFIRTSGEERISNFFLWQLAYTELYFTSIHWPDFNKEEFEKALASFKNRERRYGKTSHQIDENNHV